MIISVEDLRMNYRYFKKEKGVYGSIKDLFFRKYLYKEALKGITFKVESPGIIGLIGPNGAGKTTTLKILSGLIRPSGGKAEVLGCNPYDKKIWFKKKLSFLMGNKNQSFLNLPAMESFNANRIIYDIDRFSFEKRVKALTEMLGIEDKINIPVRNLSFGERMKVEFVLALLHDPDIIFLDEPTIGMDLITQYNIRKYIRDYLRLRKDATFIVTSHNMTDIEELCDRIIIIKEGVFIYDGMKKDLKDNNKSIEVYFHSPLSSPEENEMVKLKYQKINDIFYRKDSDFRQFQDDWNALLSTMDIKDLTFKEIEFEKIISRYMGGSGRETEL
jgi:ABC-2 type transport system ATP-binding protein